jgi:hypothetical protein
MIWMLCSGNIYYENNLKNEIYYENNLKNEIYYENNLKNEIYYENNLKNLNNTFTNYYIHFLVFFATTTYIYYNICVLLCEINRGKIQIQLL